MGEEIQRDSERTPEQDAMVQMMQIEREQKAASRKRNMGCLMAVGVLGAAGCGAGILLLGSFNKAVGPAMASSGDTLLLALGAAVFLGMVVWGWLKHRK